MYVCVCLSRSKISEAIFLRIKYAAPFQIKYIIPINLLGPKILPLFGRFYFLLLFFSKKMISFFCMSSLYYSIFLLLIVSNNDILSPSRTFMVAAITCYVGYGQRGLEFTKGLQWTRSCPLTKYCFEVVTDDIKKMQKIIDYPWDSVGLKKILHTNKKKYYLT